MAHPLPTTIISGVAVVSLALTVLAFLAWRRTGNRKLLLVTLAFGLFFVKGVLTAVSLFYEIIGHETLELVDSGFDLVILVLLISPFLLRR